MNKRIWYIYGAGGLGRECYDIAYLSLEDVIIEFLEDKPSKDKINGVTSYTKILDNCSCRGARYQRKITEKN